MRKSPKFSPEVVERAVRMVFNAKDQYPSQWAAIESIAGKIGCTAEMLRRWVRQGERDGGVRDGPTTAEQQLVRQLEREVRELRRANESLKLASAFIA
jgi:transposase